MNTKYVFLDVDGTLVNFKSNIPESAVYALKAAKKNGHKMILATGRQKSQIYPWLLKRVNFDGMIASSGAYIEAEGREIYHNIADHDHLKRVIDFFRDNYIPFVIQSKDRIIAQKECVENIVGSMGKQGSSETLINSVFGNVMYTDKPEECDVAEKIAYYNAHVSMDDIRNKLGNYYYIVGYSLGGNSNITGHGEINFNGINKASGIETFLSYYNASAKDSIAIGDSENDITMLNYSKLGVAMGNSEIAVKRSADIVTTAIDNDGLYNAFKLLDLIY